MEIKNKDIEKERKIISDLQKTIAEKEKEIKNLVLAHFESEINKPVLTTTQMINQDKISFAVEQLEKVKSAFGLINSKLDKVETIKEYIHYIDHQINELKGKWCVMKKSMRICKEFCGGDLIKKEGK